LESEGKERERETKHFLTLSTHYVLQLDQLDVIQTI